MDHAAAQRFVEQAHAILERGDSVEARKAFVRALLADPDCLEAYKGLAHLKLPGAHYLDILSCIHETLRPNTYVEIGVDTGASFARALSTTRCVGIDPSPCIQIKLSPNAAIFSMTSDEFFANYDLIAVLNDQPVDLAFVDGMHLFENALTDFINLERHCAANGAIVLHDCLPLDSVTASRTRTTQFWTGDTWRVLPTLVHFRPELAVTVIGSPPSGLAIVRGLDPGSDVLTENWDDALAYGLELDIGVTLDFPLLGVAVLPSEGGIVSQSLAEGAPHH